MNLSVFSFPKSLDVSNPATWLVFLFDVFILSKMKNRFGTCPRRFFCPGRREGSGARGAGRGRQGFPIEPFPLLHLDEVVVAAAHDSSDGSQDGAYGDDDHDSRAGDTKRSECLTKIQIHRGLLGQGRNSRSVIADRTL